MKAFVPHENTEENRVISLIVTPLERKWVQHVIKHMPTFIVQNSGHTEQCDGSHVLNSLDVITREYKKDE